MTDTAQGSPPEPNCHALADRLLLEHGRIEPIELLLAANLLAYQDYEAWRLGQRPDLQGALRVAPDVAADLLRRAAEYAQGQRLAQSAIEYRCWGGCDQPLRVGTHADLAAACAVGYAPPANRAQLDLFHDSSAAIAEEGLRRALAERRIDEARQQLARLMQADPRHARLGGFLRLIEALEAGERDRIDRGLEGRLSDLDDIEPLAHQLLGHRARDVLSPLWTTLAEQLSGRAFDPAHPRLHASHAWARAGRWEEVRAAIEAELDWRAESALVAAHAEACWRRRQAAAAWRDWMWLCWEHPSAAERLLASPDFPDPRLRDHWRRFGDLDDELATEDFPAWLLLADPSMPAAVPPDSAPPDDRGAAYCLLHALLTDADTLARRQELADTDRRLLALSLSAHRTDRG